MMKELISRGEKPQLASNERKYGTPTQQANENLLKPWEQHLVGGGSPP